MLIKILMINLCGVRPSKLGQFKLENVFKEIVFLAPKVYGGITENYKPVGRDINSYDVNSLYPHSMKTFPMPTGQPSYVKGDLKNIIDFVGPATSKTRFSQIPFGFFNVNVIAPSFLDKPFLPTRMKSSNGIRTIFPIGE